MVMVARHFPYGFVHASVGAGSFITRIAAINALTARTCRPATSDSNLCSNHVLTLGATNPPRFPSALIVAIPAAAPTPPKCDVGNVQKIGCAEMIPAVTRHIAAIAAAGGRWADSTNPTPIAVSEMAA